MTQATVIGIDIGTSSIKAVAVDPSGGVLAIGNSPMSVAVKHPGWSEQNPEDWWSGTCSAIRQVLADIDSPEVLGVGLSGQMHSLVALDSASQVIRPAILWNDVRSSQQAASVRATVGDDNLRRLTGNPALEGFTVTKLMWMRDHEPDNYAQVSHMLLAKDYIRFRLTGELETEPSDASATLLYNVSESRWSDEMCDALGISPALLPRLVESADSAGAVTESAAGDTGLSVGIPVVGGGADNACGAIGAGAVSAGDVLFSIGTSGTVVAPTLSPVTDPRMRIHAMRHAIPDTWYLMGVVLSAGAALDWWRRASGGAEFDHLVNEASTVDAGCDGVTFLPYLTGERTPHADANARGVFFGMHGGTTRAHMTRAVMEGVSFALRDSLELMTEINVDPKEAIAVGGGAGSQFWLQMLSDIVDLPMRTVEPAEGAPLGAAMLAAVGAGEFSSVAEVSDKWLQRSDPVSPRDSVRDLYDSGYQRYRDLYPVLKDTFAKTSVDH